MEEPKTIQLPEERKILSKEEMIKILDELSTLPDFDKLPLPQCYLEAKGISEDEFYQPKTLKEVVNEEFTREERTKMRLRKKLEARKNTPEH